MDDITKCTCAECLVKETCERFTSIDRKYNTSESYCDFSHVCNEDSEWNFKITNELNKRVWSDR